MMIPQLGLVCITASDEVRFRTITRTRLLSLPLAEQRARLLEVYQDNLARFDKAIDFCVAHQIQLYRVTSSLFPFSDNPLGIEVLGEIAPRLRELGERIAQHAIRVVSHPDQFVVLSSDSDSVIRNSIQNLEMHARVMDGLALPRSPWACLEIHGGKSGRSQRLIETLSLLPESVRSRIVLENDEYAYSAEQILEVCRTARVPMVFDAHHHVVAEGLSSYDHPSVGHFLEEAAKTWPRREWQLVHISNGREDFQDCRHSDFIQTMPSSYSRAPWIEVEAKLKEQAIRKLRDEWKPLRSAAA